MAETRKALILHLTAGGEPLVFAVEDTDALATALPGLLGAGSVETLALQDGTSAVVNFSHVVTAHLDVLPAHVTVYGTPRRGPGFGG
ncbi:hypothetical protein ACOBQX_17500 [Actinokineospora sp. G85]|uniref:hypothetical protein n=1 Tax=Actinokineospora sp. G85 TaxID=3406626 RepID=UPI003C77BF30